MVVSFQRARFTEGRTSLEEEEEEEEEDFKLSFDFKHTWCRLFQKHVVRTKFDTFLLY